MTSSRCPLLALLLAAACGRAGTDRFEASGTVEVPEVDISALSTARVVAVRVEEGARVEAGDTLAALTQVDLDASIAAERARVATAQANLRDLEAGSRPEEIARARAELSAARAEVDRTGKDLERVRSLVSRELASRESLDNAVSAEQVARGRMDAAEEALRLLQAGSRREQVAGARAAVAGARAALAQIEARATDLVLTAPVAGIVLSRNAEPGEALGAGVPVLTLGEMARPFVRVYLPQSVVSGLAIGAAAEVLTGDGRRLPGRVVAINPRAEFTPRVALTESERADLMFGVKVEFDDPAAAPYPGLWVTVRVAEARRQGGKEAR
ncbi:MAG TPA: HlyD family efflux transporter periplasmic adaptor subunit [Gemmatimonadales bacterium]|nr:HlyD family efflux transporter periplasmic adaptor subunit [Gemmatimonadales bacterium]